MDEIPLSTLLIALAVLLLLAGFFSIAETSMMAVNRYRLKVAAKHPGKFQRGARQTLELLANTDKLLGLVLLGNTLINAAAATLTTLIAVRMFGQHRWTLAASTVAISFIILVFSEITPKVAGAAYADSIAPPLSYVLRPLMRLSTPVIWFVNLFVRAILKVLHLRADEGTAPMSQEELRALVLEGSHFLPPKHHSILLNVFELEKITVDDVMTPRVHIEALDLEADSESLRRQILTSSHTRIPVYRGSAEQVMGVVHVRQVLQLIKQDEWNISELEAHLRPAYFIPSGTALLGQLQQFQENHQRLGLIVDEYGELQGLVTVEDILEEIIGEYTTQLPNSADSFRHEEGGSVIVEGTSLLRTLNRKLGTQFPLDGPKTLNGLIQDYLGEIPEAGLSFKLGNYTIEILHAQDRVVKVVRLRPTTPRATPSGLQAPDQQALSRN